MTGVPPEIRVQLPWSLRTLYQDTDLPRSAEVRLNAHNVRELLDELARRHPQIHVRICDERGEPRRHINVFVNEDHVRARAGLDTPLLAGDSVFVLPAVSGG